MVSKGNLLIGDRISVPSARVDALLQHEIGTHVLTYFNGRCQPLRILYDGMAGYDTCTATCFMNAQDSIGLGVKP